MRTRVKRIEILHANNSRTTVSFVRRSEWKLIPETSKHYTVTAQQASKLSDYLNSMSERNTTKIETYFSTRSLLVVYDFFRWVFDPNDSRFKIPS